MEALILLVGLVLVCCLVLPIIAIVRTSRIRQLEARLSGVEAALLRLQHAPPEQAPAQAVPPRLPLPVPTEAEIPAIEQDAMPQAAVVAPPPLPPPPRESLEVIIGRRWIVFVAIALIVGATAFFLKYAFENGWIGELGRVTLGLAAGLTLVWIGHDRYRKGWRHISQVLVGGGVTVLYLSIYAAFAYYHLIGQTTAFIVLAVVVAEAYLLALTYDARAIAVLALVGGFLVPMLLSTGRDQYRVLFTYIAILDIGMLAVVLSRRWRWIGSIAYIGTQVLFWGWYDEHYHPDKRSAALLFQLIIFVLFLLADLAPNLRRESARWEELIRLVVNPLALYATCYSLLNEDQHIWMGTLAIGVAILYTTLARFHLTLQPPDRRVFFVLLATAITFVTIAIPVQLESNWITIAWSVEALVLLWAAFKVPADLLRWFSAVGFSLALIRWLFFDTPWSYRTPFTPVINRYFLEALVLTACLAWAAYLSRHLRTALPVAFAAFAVLWLSSSVEAYTYFASRAQEVQMNASASRELDLFETARRLRWAAQLSLSLLWSTYAGLLMAAGFRFRMRAPRIAGLALFGLTLAKVALLDTAELQQFYRIIALLVLGLVLLIVSWAYQRIPQREESR